MGDQDAARRLSPRRWRILSYLAQHGSASTLDVALVCAVSRLTAHRDLVGLHEAGLVRRERSPEDRTHTWWYEVKAKGTEVLRRALTASGRPVPLRLSQRSSGRADALLFLPLIEVSRRNPGRCELFQWLAMMETSSWLRQYDLAQLRADGYGIWLQDGRCLRFLVHVDRGPVGDVVAEHERPASGLGGLWPATACGPAGAGRGGPSNRSGRRPRGTVADRPAPGATAECCRHDHAAVVVSPLARRSGMAGAGREW
ncbi:DeoR family transcriptional regulator [Micromonospora sp. NPDC049497]|uniref:DeoR family transcriptional regulator n=1 Tax=Micromonospora sp. NPDC049497 TaxID=3364273 RepID=UPI0037B0C8C4